MTKQMSRIERLARRMCTASGPPYVLPDTQVYRGQPVWVGPSMECYMNAGVPIPAWQMFARAAHAIIEAIDAKEEI